MIFHNMDEFVQCIKKNKIYIFGTGTYGMVYTHFFEKENIFFEGYVDNNIEKQGMMINEKRVYSVDETIGNGSIYLIATMPSTSIQIYKELINKGLKDKDIIYFDDFSVTDDVSYSLVDKSVLEDNCNIKNIFEGKRGFAIGNGPSLTRDVLKKIKDEYSFATNKAYQMIGIEDWHPTGFVLNDTTEIEILNKKNINIYKSKFAEYLFLNELSLLNNGIVKLNKKNNIYYYITERYKSNENYNGIGDMTKSLLDLETTMHIILQVMIYLGFKEIYLVGMDYHFKYEIDNNGKVIHNNIKNHCDMQEDDDGMYSVYYMTKGFEIINKYAKKNGIHIYNATPNSGLDVFERKNLDLI